MMPDSFELGPIRPPSEAYSLLIRVTRNCPWNRCQFCHVYKGQRFELRPVEDIKQDILTARSIRDGIAGIAARSGQGENLAAVAAAFLSNPLNEAYYNVALWLDNGGTTAFLQDANTLIMPTDDLVEVITFLKQTLPTINRVTSYARSKTAAKKTLPELIRLREAGLTRLHIGLESGYDPALEYMDKGVTAEEHIAGGKNIVASGISLSEYVLIGIGGKTMWRENARETARVLNRIDPDFIRIRTLTVKEGMPLYEKVKSGDFQREMDEEIVAEEKILLESLDCHSNIISDHITNLLQEIEGKFPQDKPGLLDVISRFQSLSPEERLNFRLGRRLGIYERLDDLYNPSRKNIVTKAIREFSPDGKSVDEKVIFSLMERFI
jgi:radical SAM superfamily enzyme YgiQ (UPF0313 family)